MPVSQLDAESIGDIDDGAVAVAINQELRKVFLDLNDRPMLKNARKVVIQLEMKPRVPGPELDDIETVVQITSKIPNKSTSCVMLGGTDGIEFHNKVSEDPRQMHIDDE